MNVSSSTRNSNYHFRLFSDLLITLSAKHPSYAVPQCYANCKPSPRPLGASPNQGHTIKKPGCPFSRSPEPCPWRGFLSQSRVRVTGGIYSDDCGRGRVFWRHVACFLGVLLLTLRLFMLVVSVVGARATSAVAFARGRRRK